MNYLPVYGRIPYHSLFAHFLPARLKLRLDQAHHPPLVLQQIPGGNQDLRQRDKGHIHAGKIRFFLDIPRLHITEIGLFHTHHPGVAAQLPIQLPMPHVHGIDFCRSVLQHAVGKSSCGSSDVHAHQPLQRNIPDPHGLLQFQASPAHIFLSCTSDLQTQPCHFEHASGLILLLAVHIHNPRHNDGLGFLPGRRIALPYQDHIQTFFHTLPFKTSDTPF